MSVVGRSSGAVDWVRNRIHVAQVVQHTELTLGRAIRGASASVATTRLDDEGLRAALAIAETTVHMSDETPLQYMDQTPDSVVVHPTLWSDNVFHCPADERTALAQQMVAPSEGAGVDSFGTLRTTAESVARLSTDGSFRYYATTSVEVSMTVRDLARSASGWAGVNHYDLAKIDFSAIATRSLEKCQRSGNPQAIEPGRYTVVLEPQALADLLVPVMETPAVLDRSSNEMGFGPFAGGETGRAKIGERVLDPRLTLATDPMDPDGGFVPFEAMSGTPYQAVRWIDHGILRELAYDQSYALAKLNRATALLNPRSFRLMPVPTVITRSVDEMIASTERGLLVTRFSEVRLLDITTLLCTGYTRDGLWLIERGKITKAIKNFRFTESPLFVLNNVQEIGVPVRVFRPGFAYVVPPVRVSDFSMSSLADVV